MIALGPLAFAAPWALAALLVLPLLWFLLRATPPAPVESAPARAMQRLRIENRANKAGRRRSRLSVIGLVLSLGFVISAGRAVQVAAMGAFADDEVGAVMAEAAPVRRASLLDRDGEILAATLDFHSVYADPLYVWDAEEVAQQLATVLPDLDVERLTRRLSSNSRYVPIADGLSPRMRQAIHLLGLPGINFEVEPGRIYPKQRVAAHLVGYVDGQMQGVAGAERAFEAANTLDPTLPEPAFFLGAAYYARGERNAAATVWSDIIARLDEGDPFRAAIAARAADLLSRPQGGPGSDGAAPFADAIAEGVDPADLAEMMVSRLEARLEENPDDLSGWLTLARARWTQGQSEAGLEALERARLRFEGQAGALALIAAMQTAFSVEESEQ